MSVTITLPDRGDLRVSPAEAAQLLVAAYGPAAVDQTIVGRRGDFDATWCEVDRLLEERKTGAVTCPCGGRHFRAVYRVETLHVVALSRADDGEILLGPPGAQLVAPRAAEASNFHELLCAHCGERLDWSIDHRSLYVWERAHG
jgi:hypothetical protein